MDRGSLGAAEFDPSRKAGFGPSRCCEGFQMPAVDAGATGITAGV